MLTHPTLDQMAALGLTGMADAWKALAGQDPGQALDRNEWLGLMLDREVSTRADKRFANRLRNARLRFPDACIEDVNFAASRGLDRRQILALAQGEWIKAKEQIILTGGNPPLRCGRAIYFRRPEMAALVGKSNFQPKTGAAGS